jgi:Protein of unknown function (DUF3024)
MPASQLARRKGLSRRVLHLIAGGWKDPPVLPALDLAAVNAYCEQRVPPHALREVRVEAVVSRGAVTIVERRAPWRPDYGLEWTTSDIARLRYNGRLAEWTVYWRDRDGRWHRYEQIEPSSEVKTMLDEIDADPTGIFWG